MNRWILLLGATADLAFGALSAHNYSQIGTTVFLTAALVLLTLSFAIKEA